MIDDEIIRICGLPVKYSKALPLGSFIVALPWGDIVIEVTPPVSSPTIATYSTITSFVVLAAITSINVLFIICAGSMLP